MSKEKFERRMRRLDTIIHWEWGVVYRIYARLEREAGKEPMIYRRWIGTLPKNQQIKHAEYQRRLEQAAQLCGYTTEWTREQRMLQL